MIHLFPFVLFKYVWQNTWIYIAAIGTKDAFGHKEFEFIQCIYVFVYFEFINFSPHSTCDLLYISFRVIAKSYHLKRIKSMCFSQCLCNQENTVVIFSFGSISLSDHVCNEIAVNGSQLYQRPAWLDFQRTSVKLGKNSNVYTNAGLSVYSRKGSQHFYQSHVMIFRLQAVQWRERASWALLFIGFAPSDPVWTPDATVCHHVTTRAKKARGRRSRLPRSQWTSVVHIHMCCRHTDKLQTA